LPRRYSSHEVIAVLLAAGSTIVSQRGSHVKLRRRVGEIVRTIIVKHPDSEIPAGTLASILRQAELSRDEFERLL
jgi:predicted RNA binding protein YcfA (HicA-like mRNA interferase family)